MTLRRLTVLGNCSFVTDTDGSKPTQDGSNRRAEVRCVGGVVVRMSGRERGRMAGDGRFGEVTNGRLLAFQSANLKLAD